MLNAPTDSAVLFDRAGTLLDYNVTAAQRIPNPNMRRGANIYSFFPPQLAEMRRARNDEVFRTGQAIRYEDERNGIWFDNIIYPVFDANGQVTKVAVLARDITDRRRMELDLRLAAKRAESLAHIAARFNTQLNLEAVLTAVCEETQRALNVQAASVSLYDPATGQLTVAAVAGIPADYIERASFVKVQQLPVASLQIIPDIQALPDAPNQSLNIELDIRTVIYIQLVRDQALIGILSALVTGGMRDFTPPELDLLRALTDHAAQAIANARLLAETQRRAHEFETLTHLAKRLNAQLELETVLAVICEEATRALNVSAASMSLYDPVSDALRFRAIHGLPVTFGERFTPLPRAVYTWDGPEPPMMVISDMQAMPGLPDPDLYAEANVRSLISVGLYRDQDLLGNLNFIMLGQVRDFSPTEQQLAQVFAHQAAPAIHSARLFDETRLRAREFETLYAITRDIAEQLDLSPLLQAILDRTTSLFESHSGTVYLYDSARNDLSLAIAGGPVPLFIYQRILMGQGAVGLVAQTRQPLRLENYPEWEQRLSGYDTEPVFALLVVPMLYSGQLIGVLELARLTAAQSPFTLADERRLQLIATQAATAVYNAQLFAAVQTRARELETLYVTARSLAAQLNLEALFTLTLEQVMRLFASVSASIYLYDADAGALYLALTDGEIALAASPRMALGQGALGRAAQTRQPVRIDSYLKWEHCMAGYENSKLAGLMAVPMLYSGQLIGVLEVARTTPSNPHPYTEAEAHLLTLLATQVASAVHNAQLFAGSQERARQLEALYVTAHALTAQLDLDTLFKMTLEHIMPLLDSVSASIYLYDADVGDLSLALTDGEMAMSAFPRMAVGQGAIGRAAQTRQPVRIENYLTWEHRIAGYKTSRLAGLMAVPMLYSGQLVGVLEVARTTASDPHPYTEAEAHLLTLLATQVASAVHNAQLFAGSQARARELEALYVTARALAAQLNLEALYKMTLEQVMPLFDSVSASIYLYDADAGDVYLTLTDGEIGMSASPRIALGQGAVGRAAQTRQPVRIENYLKWEHRMAGYENSRLAGLMAVPMLYSGQLIGVLEIGRTTLSNPRPYTEAEAHLLMLLATQVASAVHNAQLFDAVNTGRERLRQLTQQLVLDQEKEQQRVSRELHDEAGQVLAALRLNLAGLYTTLAAERSALAENLQQALTLLDETIQRTRQIARDLHPPGIDLVGLHGVLRDYCERHTETSHLPIDYTGEPVPDLSSQANISLYRFVQEAITNVIKHARATQVWVVLQADACEVTLTVTDNGHGFDPRATTPKMNIGLLGMRERLDSVGGQLEVTSALGQGTRLVARLPAPAPESLP